MEKEEGVDGKELKTLKDLRILDIDEYENSYVSISQLKAEAVKWIKAYLDEKQTDKRHGWILAEEFKEFFNITEEEQSSGEVAK